MKYIENEGALYKGPSRAFPAEVWRPAKKEWAPYEAGEGKPEGWGEVISPEEAEAQFPGSAA